MKRDIKLSNAVVNPYGNKPSDAHSSRDANDERPSKLLKNVTIEEDEEVCYFFNSFFDLSFLFFFYYIPLSLTHIYIFSLSLSSRKNTRTCWPPTYHWVSKVLA